MEPKPRNATLEKILGTKVANELETPEPREAIKDMRAAVASPMLDVFLKNGDIESFNWAYLHKMKFRARGELALHFADDVVVLQGRNLRDIRKKLSMHKVDEIYEGSDAEDALKPEADAHIDRIQIFSEKEAEREAKRNDPERSKGMER